MDMRDFAKSPDSLPPPPSQILSGLWLHGTDLLVNTAESMVDEKIFFFPAITTMVYSLKTCNNYAYLISNIMQGNKTQITEFILLGFEESHNLQIFLFLVFLVIYILTIVANFLTFLLIVTDQHLHTPMYFFLGNLSCLEMMYSSTILPRMLSDLLTRNKTISFKQCLIQLYFFACLVGTECYLLCVMSYDRFLAICKPLHYANLMNGKLCIQLAAGSWINGTMFTSIYLAFVLQLWYCGPYTIDHFFCDSLSLIEISCGDTSFTKQISIILAFIFTFPPFLLTLLSYIYIITTILKIPSATGRQKAFSTCSSHLIVVALFYGSIIIVYIFPKIETMRDSKKIFSLLYTVLPPIVNPLVYSLRNKDVRDALRKAAGKILEEKCMNQKLKV
ncbi:olfactory receptor 6F1-like [Paroedura picta]|uniref:olfactory receptor 6F1-like n=1 Tax=Paroedura picta TaxID=143630 RepID=UPI004055D1DF